MRHESWMERDERTPEEKRRDRLRSLRQQEAALVKEAAEIETRLQKLRIELYDPSVQEPATAEGGTP